MPVVPHPKKVSVLVLNSTSKDGIATATQKALTKQGFHVTDATNDGAAYGGHGQIKGVGEIRYGPRGLPAATLVHLYLPKSAMRETDASSKLVTVSLGAAYKLDRVGQVGAQGAARAAHPLRHAQAPPDVVLALLTAQPSTRSASSSVSRPISAGASPAPAATTSAEPGPAPRSPVTTQPASSATSPPAARSHAFRPASK